MKLSEARAPRKLLTCRQCSTRDVSMTVTCHNSDCGDYAKEHTVYEGWNIHE
jgi:hypothetical protein